MNKKNTRAVTFSQPTDVDSACTEVDVVMDVIRRTFSDVLKPGQEFFLKAKSEDPDWDGVFVDVQVKDSLTDKSVVRAELKESDTDDTNKILAQPIKHVVDEGHNKRNNVEEVLYNSSSPSSSVQLRLDNQDGNICLRRPNAKECAIVAPAMATDKSTVYIKEHSKNSVISQKRYQIIKSE
ncbi:uncharacterized protein [Dysidea avara]|uniref:uncharacterized protein isoform X2 n=1 Tax=Dysidea avara TaxID=196820 RepID=UPI00331751B1